MQLFDVHGSALGLATPLDRGGEAEIYQISDSPFRVAKIYHPQHRTAERRRKLELMIADPPDDPENARGHASIAWPTDLVVDARGDFLGFLMPGIDTAATRKLVDVYNVSSYPEGLTWGHLLLAARNLAVALSALHRKGYVVGDLNESNLLVSRKSLITFVDCDSMQTRDGASGQVFRCPVGKGEYSPPELHGVFFGAVDRTPESDAFALAVMISQLLLLGRHPFAGGSSPRIEDNILRQDSFLLNEGQPPAGTPSVDLLPAHSLDLLIRCFREGHGEPRRRPTADDWVVDLDLAYQNLKTCDRQQVHSYSSHLPSCPWCLYLQDFGFDPFIWSRKQKAGVGRRVSAGHTPGKPTSVSGSPAIAPRPAPTPKVTSVHLPVMVGSTTKVISRAWPMFFTILVVVMMLATLAIGPLFFDQRKALPPPKQVFAQPSLDSQALVGTYTGFVGNEVAVLQIQGISKPFFGIIDFDYVLDKLNHRIEGTGFVMVPPFGGVYIPAFGTLYLSLDYDPGRRLILYRYDSIYLWKERG